MILITEDIRKRLLANGAVGGEVDHVPVVKFFDPTGEAIWIITEMMPEEHDTLFGLCDFGFPELGYLSFSELVGIPARYGFTIERDLSFRARFPISVYAEAARRLSRITESEDLLAEAARALGLPDDPEFPPDTSADPAR